MVMRVSPGSLDWLVGMRFYLTGEQGVGGVIKQRPEDFVVEEISEQDLNSEGRYLIVELEKRDWEMHNLVREIAGILRISRKRIDWAGTKDKRAVTRQRISIWDVDEDMIDRIRIPGVRLRVLGRSRRKIALGDLHGNRFEIVIRGVRNDGDLEGDLQRIQDTIRVHGGVINYFGYQRFGIQRPINHTVGELIVRGKLEDAVRVILTARFGTEDEAVERAREFIHETWDLKEAINLMPQGLLIERSMIHALINRPGDYHGAFMSLPRRLYRIFVHAYQSYIFNLIVSARLEEGLGLNEAYEGDVVCFRGENGFPDVTRWQVVRSTEVDAINRLIKMGRAFVTAPIVGFETEIADGIQGEIEHRILESLKITPQDFRVPHAEEFASKGLRREIKLPVDPSFEVLGDGDVKISFTLPKGGYATTVLREFMKNEITPGKGFEPLRG
ncbi:MAG: tRNA pseudouridine(13) synthase TruD [Candidatus Syntrophoarchaeum sp. WYZ-LMO15]|nr:MAG: tRNA pseudouridine(13) synthase TruD [Candidatus Syntrophoarchaeum sp. WYZ-LMO15]